MKQRLAVTSLIASSILTVSAQGPTGKLEFEVASVKQVDPKDQSLLANLPGPVAEVVAFRGGPGTSEPERIDYRGVTLQALLARAYHLKSQQISGPGWLGSERYVIEAKVPPKTTPDQMRQMLQNLLTERFQISLHRVVKPTPVYRLKVAKDGPKLKPPQDLDDDKRQKAIEKQQENVAKRVAERESNDAKGIKTPGFRAFGMPRATTESFAENLSGYVDRPVKDMTQLKGEYFFRVEWTPDGLPQEDAPSRVSIFMALQQQLGLKLEAANEPIEWLVIDKAERKPVSN